MDRRALEAADERLRHAAVLGVFTMRIALDAGLTRGVVRGRLAAGSWAHVAGSAHVVLPGRRQANRGISPHYFDLARRDVRRMLSFRLTSPRRRPGVVQLRRLLAVGRAGALSEAERRLHRILRDAGIDGREADQPIVVGGTLLARADVLFPAARLIVEVDGRKAHQDVEADRERLNALALAGCTVLRFTWRQLVERPWRVREQIEAALRRAAG